MQFRSDVGGAADTVPGLVYPGPNVPASLGSALPPNATIQPGLGDGWKPNWFRPGGPPAGTPATTFPPLGEAMGWWQQSDGSSGGDGNPFSNMGGLMGQLGGLIDGIERALQNLFGSLGAQLASTVGANSATYGPSARVADADVDSVGDPHLSMSGTDASGNLVNDRYDSMVGHGDLVDANASIPGGYQVSTTTTTPDANGVTYNQNATVTMNSGADSVTMNADGSTSVTSNGQAVSVAYGQTVTLSGGATVTNGPNGYVVGASDGLSGTVTTTLSRNGHGVDCKTHAHNVTLGGDVVSDNARKAIPATGTA